MALLVCPASWFAYVALYDWISALLGHPDKFSDLVGLTRPLFSSSTFWLTALLIPFVCLLRDFSWKLYVYRSMRNLLAIKGGFCPLATTLFKNYRRSPKRAPIPLQEWN